VARTGGHRVVIRSRREVRIGGRRDVRIGGRREFRWGHRAVIRSRREARIGGRREVIRIGDSREVTRSRRELILVIRRWAPEPHSTDFEHKTRRDFRQMRK
jgi:hypothetical protein